MPIVKFTAPDLRNPEDSKRTLIHNEDAEDCFGEACGNYHEENTMAVKPRSHSHLVITGQDPATTSRRYAIAK